MPNKFEILDPDCDDEEEHMSSNGKNPSDRGEESVTVGSAKLDTDQEVISPETEESATKAEEAAREAQEGALLVGLDSTGGEPSMRKEESRKKPEMAGMRSEMQRDEEEPEMQQSADEDHLPNGIERALLDIKEKFAQRRALRRLVKDLSEKFDIAMRSTSAIDEHPPMFESDKLLIESADPSATDSLTRLGQRSVQDDLDHGRGESATALAKKMADEMAAEAEDFFLHYSLWKSQWSETCGSFELTTLLSSMQFTHYTPGCLPPNRAASTPATLQIFSIKLAEVAGDLHWPLSVYGKVVVRDVVDRNRNFIFSRRRENSQELTQDDPFLRLIGPSRAVVYTDRVTFEIQLYVKGTTKSQDKPLITQARDYHELFGDASTVCFKNCFCTIELRVQVVERTTQATILGVQADISAGKPYPFEYGARVICSPLPGKSKYPEIVMVDSKDGAMLKGSDGYLHLPRDVVSVDYEGRLDVEIQAYSKSGKIVAKKHVSFLPRLSKISRGCCTIRGVEVVITVAWSRVAEDKLEVMAFGSLVQDRCS